MRRRRLPASAGIESDVNRLVEGELARRAARTELDRFKEDTPPPSPPDEFPNLRSFIEYAQTKWQYEELLKKRESDLSDADGLYREAAERLRDVLPENVPLHHEHSGFAHVIVNRQGEVIITEMTPLRGPPQGSIEPWP